MTGVKLFLTDSALIQPPNWNPFYNLIDKIIQNQEEFLEKIGIVAKNLDHFLIHKLVKYQQEDWYDTLIITKKSRESIAVREHDILNANDGLAQTARDWFNRYSPPYLAVTYPDAEARISIWFKRNKYQLETITE